MCVFLRACAHRRCLFAATLYYLYFICVNGAMDVFNCGNPRLGKPAMSSEPSISCARGDPQHELLLKLATVSVVVYGLGIPLFFGYVLVVHRRGIQVCVHVCV
jgi:hypothetical protein